MFEKLLALTPYNPGLIPQLHFYSRRMREEASIRRTATVFIFLAFLLQSFAVLNPPQPSLASSPNDLISGGISSAADARSKCVNDTQGYQKILHYYGISCSAFDNAESTTILSNGADNHYYSAGQLPQGAPGEVAATIQGAGTIYWKHLSFWGQQSWAVLKIKDQNGKIFYVIKDCANLVTYNVPPHNPLLTAEDTGGSGHVPDLSTPAPAPVTPAVATPAPTTPATTPQPCPYVAGISATDINCTARCEYNSSLPATSRDCKPCVESTSSSDTVSCVGIKKSATNVTAGIADANNTTAKPGDVITYTLYATNNAKVTLKSFYFKEDLRDVLDYADVVDLHGGNMPQDGIVQWDYVYNIPAGATVTKQITVKVKDPLPMTPTSSSDPGHFDLTMTNVYGNAVNIKLPGSPAKTVEVAAATLPNTGPGTTLFIAASIVIMAGYFYSRAGLLARESEIAVKETALA